MMNILRLKTFNKVLWNLSTTESGNSREFDIEISTDTQRFFQFKYLDVIDVRASRTFLMDANRQAYPLEFVVTIFVDLLNEGDRQRLLIKAKQHGLISMGSGMINRPNAVIHIVDLATAKVIYSSPTKGKVSLIS